MRQSVLRFDSGLFWKQREFYQKFPCQFEKHVRHWIIKTIPLNTWQGKKQSAFPQFVIRLTWRLPRKAKEMVDWIEKLNLASLWSKIGRRVLGKQMRTEITKTKGVYKFCLHEELAKETQLWIATRRPFLVCKNAKTTCRKRSQLCIRLVVDNTDKFILQPSSEA